MVDILKPLTEKEAFQHLLEVLRDECKNKTYEKVSIEFVRIRDGAYWEASLTLAGDSKPSETVTLFIDEVYDD